MILFAVQELAGESGEWMEKEEAGQRAGQEDRSTGEVQSYLTHTDPYQTL